MSAFRSQDAEDMLHRYGSGLPQKIGLVLLTILILILVWASVAYVPAGHVGVLTLFGRVTGDVLPEGTHFVNPFKINNTMSVRTQELKETASVPSDEGLDDAGHVALVSLEPGEGGRSVQDDRTELCGGGGRAELAVDNSGGDFAALARMRFTLARAKKLLSRSTRNSCSNWERAEWKCKASCCGIFSCRRC